MYEIEWINIQKYIRNKKKNAVCHHFFEFGQKKHSVYQKFLAKIKTFFGFFIM